MAKVLVQGGVKMYPVCGFQRSQHKLYYWANHYYLIREESDANYDEWQAWQEICEYATNVHDGLIYMPYRFYNKVKEAIVAYDLRH